MPWQMAFTKPLLRALGQCNPTKGLVKGTFHGSFVVFQKINVQSVSFRVLMAGLFETKFKYIYIYIYIHIYIYTYIYR